eukprot:11208270-Lingulodinium_polyedra.AAC.1
MLTRRLASQCCPKSSGMSLLPGAKARSLRTLCNGSGTGNIFLHQAVSASGSGGCHARRTLQGFTGE